MKFSEMPYARPDLDAVKQQFADLRTRLENAKSYAEAREIFLEEETLNKHVDTAAQLASVRNSIDTRDKFYDEEMNWNEAIPSCRSARTPGARLCWRRLSAREFEAEYGSLMFVNAEIADKAFSPAILDEMAQGKQADHRVRQTHRGRRRSPLRGGVYTLSQLSPFKNDPDDARRLAAWKAEGAWYKEHEAEFDGIYDKLVHLQRHDGQKAWL